LSYRLKIPPVRNATPAPSHTTPQPTAYTIRHRLYIFALDNQDNCIIRSYTIMDLTKFCRKTFFIIVCCSISPFLCTCNLVSKQTVKFLNNNVSMYVHKKKCMLFFIATSSTFPTPVNMLSIIFIFLVGSF
jgi:hypothetical protein